MLPLSACTCPWMELGKLQVSPRHAGPSARVLSIVSYQSITDSPEADVGSSAMVGRNWSSGIEGYCVFRTVAPITMGGVRPPLLQPPPSPAQHVPASTMHGLNGHPCSSM